jgi:hypothetical protein
MRLGCCIGKRIKAKGQRLKGTDPIHNSIMGRFKNYRVKLARILFVAVKISAKDGLHGLARH